MSNLPEPVPEKSLEPKSDRLPAGALRASDADRERVAAILREAAGEGRIELHELDERLGAVYAARTYAELEPLTADLPTAVRPEPPLPATDPDRFGGEPTSRGGFALLGGFERKGGWVAPENFTAFAMLGGGDVDLRQARFTGRKITIRAWAVLGGVQVTVPEDAEVHVGGVGILGGFDNSAAGAGGSGGPVIVVKGFALLGGVSVERKATDDVIKQRKAERKEERRQRRQERKQLR